MRIKNVVGKLTMLPIIWLFLTCTIWQSSSQSIPSCQSHIYCQGKLLDIIQRSRPFKDSKSFVDLRLINDESTTLKNFEILLNQTGQKPTRAQIKTFLQNNFKDGDELENWNLTDFNPNPPFLNRVQNETLKEFARKIVAIWPTLARKIKTEVIQHISKYSILPLPNGFVVPGGRFKETYYWDSYWIIKGLLISGMNKTAESIINNFLFMVKTYGFIPNGARIYYLNRSHPPFLTMMVDLFYKYTNNFDFIKNNLHVLEKEMKFFLNNRTVTITKNFNQYILARYDSESGSPRPESYSEDIKTCSSHKSEKEKMSCYADLKTGAESGLDFSYRWVVDGKGSNNANLSAIRTRNIIPVDLNAILCKNFLLISKYHLKIGNVKESKYWYKIYKTWLNNIQEVLYDQESGVWFDYDLELQKPRKLFYISNISPIWAEIFSPEQLYEMGGDAVNYLTKEGVLDFYGGTPTSLNNTGEQWDFPSAWPPLQSILMQGLKCSGHPSAVEMANVLAARWVRSNIMGFNKYNSMFEKYNALNPGENGGGGEYDVQTGFGWTNGVVLECIVDFFSS